MWLLRSSEIKYLRRMINDLQSKNPLLANGKLLLGKGGFLTLQVFDELESANDINRVELVEYRPKRQKSWSQALVWGDQPGPALARALGVSERELIIRRSNSSPDAATKDFV
jgi:hypothetical protein